MRERHQHCSVISTENVIHYGDAGANARSTAERLQLQGHHIAVLEGELMIEETRAQIAEIERALIQSLVTMRQ